LPTGKRKKASKFRVFRREKAVKSVTRQRVDAQALARKRKKEMMGWVSMAVNAASEDIC
jgi:ribosome assembly protein YihI (activator of Der GTPase)